MARGARVPSCGSACSCVSSAGRKWEVAAWGRNLTDTEYFYGKLSLISFFGREQGNPAPPLEWGLTFKRNFN